MARAVQQQHLSIPPGPPMAAIYAPGAARPSVQRAMLNHVVAAIFLLVFVIGPTFAEMRIAADPMGSEISDESIKN